MSDIVERLRGIYRVPVEDGAGQLNGSDEYVRRFPTAPILQEAADEIERLRSRPEPSGSEVYQRLKGWAFHMEDGMWTFKEGVSEPTLQDERAVLIILPEHSYPGNPAYPIEPPTSEVGTTPAEETPEPSDVEALREALIALNRNVGDLANSAVQAQVERVLSQHVGGEG